VYSVKNFIVILGKDQLKTLKRKSAQQVTVHVKSESEGEEEVVTRAASPPKKRPRISKAGPASPPISNEEPTPGPSSLIFDIPALIVKEEEVTEDDEEDKGPSKRRRTLTEVKTSRKKKGVKTTAKRGEKISLKSKKKPKDGNDMTRTTKKAKGKEDDDMDADQNSAQNESAQPFISSGTFQDESSDDGGDVEIIEVKQEPSSTLVYEVIQIDDEDHDQDVDEDDYIKAPSSLVQDLNAILKEMEIPDEEYDTALDFMKTLETQLAKELPSCRLIWFRNWYLKLKSMTPLDELVFFLDGRSELKEFNRINLPYKNYIYHVMFFYNSTLSGIFENLESADVKVRRNMPWTTKKKINTAISNLTTGQLGISASSKADEVRFGLECCQYLYCSKNGFTLRLLLGACRLPQIQACRLMAYFCSFDRRIKPLLAVIRY